LNAMTTLAFWTSETGLHLKPGENLIRSPLREERHASFSVNTHTGLWHDFGTGQGGDTISFVMLKYGMPFPEAKRYVEHPYRTLPNNRGYKAPQTTKPPQRTGSRGDYCILEIVRNGIHHRGSFENRPDVPDYFTIPGAIDCFHSLYWHLPGIITYRRQEGSLQGYAGPVWLREMVFDIDYKNGSITENVTNALAETRRLFKTLHEYGVAEITAKFSGGKGFHVSFSSPVQDKISGYSDTPARTEALARRIAQGLNGLDFVIYGSATRLIRSINSINSKSGLYAIPLTEAEIFLLTAEQIISLAALPRRLTSYPVKLHSRLMNENFALNTDGSLEFANGTDYTRDEIVVLFKEKDKKIIKGLHLLKTIFKGDFL